MTATFRTYIRASLDIMKEHFRILEECFEGGNINLLLAQGMNLKKELTSFIDYVRMKELKDKK